LSISQFLIISDKLRVSVLFVLVGIVFIVIYTFFWKKIFNAKTPLFTLKIRVLALKIFSGKLNQTLITLPNIDSNLKKEYKELIKEIMKAETGYQGPASILIDVPSGSIPEDNKKNYL